MANIKPVSDLRNYTTVLKDCTSESPIFLTKNGRGKYVIMDVEDYDALQQEIKLLGKIAISEQRIASGEKCLTLGELKSKLGL